MFTQSLFGIPVVTFKLGREFTENEIKFLFELETYKNIGNIVSKDAYVLEKPEMASLKEFVQSCADQYFNEIYVPGPGISLRITQSWMNYTSKGQHHHRHNHPNSFLSGSFYINANNETDKIIFYREGNPIPYNMQINSPRLSNFNSSAWNVPVGMGDLVMFPSTLTHSVDTVHDEKTRASLAFNTFPVGALGSYQGLTQLNL
jgi:uncharacterized protein (TIGR02466 family)